MLPESPATVLVGAAAQVGVGGGGGDDGEAPPAPAQVDQVLAALRSGSIPPPPDDDPTAGTPAEFRFAIAAPPGQPVTIGQLRIPAIELDVPMREGVHAEVVDGGPGHWPGTPLPTQVGNAVLSGHRTTFTKPFRDLDRLNPGDEVIVKVGEAEVVYRVEGTEIVPESRYTDVVLAQPEGPTTERVLTLFACHPKGSRQQRIVVRARADSLPIPDIRLPDVGPPA